MSTWSFLLPSTKKETLALIFSLLLIIGITELSSRSSLDSKILDKAGINILFPMYPGLPILVSALNTQDCIQGGACINDDQLIVITFILNVTFVLSAFSLIISVFKKDSVFSSAARVLGSLFVMNLLLAIFGLGDRLTIKYLGIVFILFIYYGILCKKKLRTN